MTELHLTPDQTDKLMKRLMIHWLKYDGPVFQRGEEENETS